MRTDGHEEAQHPLEKIKGWIDESEDGGISIIEYYGQGPSRLGMSELDFRGWTNEGISSQILTLGGLADVIRVRTVADAVIGQPFPREHRHHTGY